MMPTLALLKFLVGLALLVGGAEVLVRGASRLAAALGISPLVIGLTVVAFGTSAPELTVSLRSAYTGSSGLALGNVVGSNVFNVLVILGLASLIAPLTIERRLVRLDVPIMIGVAGLPLVLGTDGLVGRWEGLVLLGILTGYLSFLAWQGRRTGADDDESSIRATGGLGMAALAALLGLVMLTVGAGWLVDGATLMARRLGVSELIIGLTLVAAGTSLPEVATSIVASLRRQLDVAVGNVVGSNIFNVLAVLGASSAVSSDGVSVARAALSFDLPVMLAVCCACLPVFFTRLSIDRWEGGLFLGVYGLYVWQLFDASKAAGRSSPVFLIAVLFAGVTALTLVQLSRFRGRGSTT